MTKGRNPRGFVALMSAIIISVVLLVVTTTGSLTSFYGRLNILDTELKERSMALAEGCVDELLLRLALGQTPAGVIAIGEQTCEVKNSSNPFRIQAAYHNSYTNLEVEADATIPSITSWREVPSF